MSKNGYAGERTGSEDDRGEEEEGSSTEAHSSPATAMVAQERTIPTTDASWNIHMHQSSQQAMLPPPPPPPLASALSQPMAMPQFDIETVDVKPYYDAMSGYYQQQNPYITPYNYGSAM